MFICIDLYCKFHKIFFPYSEGSNNGIIAYYLSEFNVRESKISAVEEAIASMDGVENVRKSRSGFGRKTDNSLTIDGMTSGGKSTGRGFHITRIVSVCHLLQSNQKLQRNMGLILV